MSSRLIYFDQVFSDVAPCCTRYLLQRIFSSAARYSFINLHGQSLLRQHKPRGTTHRTSLTSIQGGALCRGLGGLECRALVLYLWRLCLSFPSWQWQLALTVHSFSEFSLSHRYFHRPTSRFQCMQNVFTRKFRERSVTESFGFLQGVGGMNFQFFLPLLRFPDKINCSPKGKFICQVLPTPPILLSIISM